MKNIRVPLRCEYRITRRIDPVFWDGAPIEQQLDNFNEAFSCRLVQRITTLADRFFGIRIGAVIQQQSDDIRVPFRSRSRKRPAATRIGSVRKRAVGAQDFAHSRLIPESCGDEDRVLGTALQQQVENLRLLFVAPPAMQPE